jgi:hypothetical protein
MSLTDRFDISDRRSKRSNGHLRRTTRELIY